MSEALASPPHAHAPVSIRGQILVKIGLVRAAMNFYVMLIASNLNIVCNV
jgi:hypothetical protein